MGFPEFFMCAVTAITPIMFGFSQSEGYQHPNGIVLGIRTIFFYVYAFSAKYILLALLSACMPFEFIQWSLEFFVGAIDPFLMAYFLINNFSDTFDLKSRTSCIAFGWAAANALLNEIAPLYNFNASQNHFAAVAATICAFSFVGTSFCVAVYAQILNRKERFDKKLIETLYIRSAFISAIPNAVSILLPRVLIVIFGRAVLIQPEAIEGKETHEITYGNRFDGLPIISLIIISMVHSLIGLISYRDYKYAYDILISKPTKHDAIGNETEKRKSTVSILNQAKKRAFKTSGLE